MPAFRYLCALALAIFYLVVDAVDDPAAAEWRAKLGTFRVGIVAGSRSDHEKLRVEPFRQALRHALDMPVEIFAARNQAALIDAQVNGRIEYAIYSASAFASAWSLCKCVEPLVTAKTSDGAFGFHSVLITRTDGPRSLKAMAGKRIAFPGRASTSGYLLPKIELVAQGISLDDKNFNLIDAGNAAKALKLLLSDKADAIFGWSSLKGDPEKGYSRGTLRQLFLKEHSSAGKPFRILWKSKFFPHGPHAVRANLDSKAKALLIDFLDRLPHDNPVAYDAIEPARSGGFVTVTLEDYRLAIEMMTGVSQAPGSSGN